MVCTHSFVFMAVALIGYYTEHKGLRCCDELPVWNWLHTNIMHEHTQYKNTEQKGLFINTVSYHQSYMSHTPLLMVRARVTTDPPNS